MAATLIQDTEVIPVPALSMLIYGPPGAWKTSIAQTAEKPLTLDFDRGAHRAFNRRAVFRFDKFSDTATPEVVSQIQSHSTVVIDTIGRMLDMLSLEIIQSGAKMGTTGGGLSLQGFGTLKARFSSWVSGLRLAGKDLVFLCHEREEKDGELRYMRPDIQGGSYQEVMKFTDLVGYLQVDGRGVRSLDFNPSDRHLGKNAAGWEAITVPSLKERPAFLAELLADAKRIIGKTAVASAQAAKTVDSWSEKIDGAVELTEFDSLVSEINEAGLGKSETSQIKKQILAAAESKGMKFDKATKRFVFAQEDAA